MPKKPKTALFLGHDIDTEDAQEIVKPRGLQVVSFPKINLTKKALLHITWAAFAYGFTYHAYKWDGYYVPFSVLYGERVLGFVLYYEDILAIDTYELYAEDDVQMGEVVESASELCKHHLMYWTEELDELDVQDLLSLRSNCLQKIAGEVNKHFFAACRTTDTSFDFVDGSKVRMRSDGSLVFHATLPVVRNTARAAWGTSPISLVVGTG